MVAYLRTFKNRRTCSRGRVKIRIVPFSFLFINRKSRQTIFIRKPSKAFHKLRFGRRSIQLYLKNRGYNKVIREARLWHDIVIKVFLLFIDFIPNVPLLMGKSVRKEIFII